MEIFAFRIWPSLPAPIHVQLDQTISMIDSFLDPQPVEANLPANDFPAERREECSRIDRLWPSAVVQRLFGLLHR
jgi:hypothetical protein